jgi:hypothetical protein
MGKPVDVTRSSVAEARAVVRETDRRQSDAPEQDPPLWVRREGIRTASLTNLIVQTLHNLRERSW